jgi:hypothetical protein
MLEINVRKSRIPSIATYLLLQPTRFEKRTCRLLALGTDYFWHNCQSRSALERTDSRRGASEIETSATSGDASVVHVTRVSSPPRGCIPKLESMDIRACPSQSHLYFRRLEQNTLGNLLFDARVRLLFDGNRDRFQESIPTP